MAIEQVTDILVVPTLVPELDDVLEVIGQAGDESIEASQVFVETWRQLVEDGSELFLEPPGERDKPVDFLVAADKLLHMRDEPVGLHGVAEAGGRFLSPAVERL